MEIETTRKLGSLGATLEVGYHDFIYIKSKIRQNELHFLVGAYLGVKTIKKKKAMITTKVVTSGREEAEGQQASGGPC